MGKKKIKRASGPTKKYEEGSQAAVGEKLKKDYDKIMSPMKMTKPR